MKLGILISGGGTTATAIIHAAQNGILQNKVDPVVVISSNAQSAGVAKIKQLGIAIEIVEKKDFLTNEAFGQKILSILQQYNVDLVSQNGWLPILSQNIIDAFPKKIINQHPGPLDPGRPDFGGKGMYGARVVCARFLYCVFAKEKNPWTESDVHIVTDKIDNGDLVGIRKMDLPAIERRITVEDCRNSTPVQEFVKHQTKQIQEMLLPIEHENVIQTLKNFAENTISIISRDNPLIPEENLEYLSQAKSIATHLFPNG